MYAMRAVAAPIEGTYRRVCNHCKWLYYVKPSRDRRILRELEARHRQT